VSAIAAVLEALLAETGASRVTLRRGVDDGYAFPVTDEALAPGVPSLRNERTVDLRAQPVVLKVRESGLVVQDDTRTAYDDPAFQRMLDVYGGVAAQIVTAVESGDDVAAILSVHQLTTPRRWTSHETNACRRAAAALAPLL
jgi:GAF domain-containing protein